jgi:hypothetical protein
MTQYKFAMISQESKNLNDSNLGCIGPNDVLLGRGGAANNHIGNRMFRAIVLQHQLEYLQSKKLDKIKVAHKIVAIIQNQGGRFLKPTGTDDAWEEAESTKALAKASQALREGLDVRHAQIRLKKNSTSASSSSNESTAATKPRKPYTIKNPLTHGKVRTTNNVPTNPSNKVVAVPLDSVAEQQPFIRNVEAVLALALLQSSAYRSFDMYGTNQLGRVL